MNEENALYVEQMNHWFAEHDRIGEQIKRTILHYEELAELNRQQLVAHEKRTEITRAEYDIWLSEHGLEERRSGAVEQPQECACNSLVSDITVDKGM